MTTQTKHLTHEKWISLQKPRNTFRDVLIQTSLIESAVIKESTKLSPLTSKEKKDYRSFGRAIQIIDRTKVIDIFELKQRRNKLMHDIFSKKLNQDQIEKVRDDMFRLIQKILKESRLVSKYLKR